VLVTATQYNKYEFCLGLQAQLTKTSRFDLIALRSDGNRKWKEF